MNSNSLLKKYINDIFKAVLKDKIYEIITKFNSFNKNLIFTAATEKDGTLPFMDVLLERQDDGVTFTNWYQKPTASNR